MWAWLFDITLYMAQYFVSMLTTIADATDTKLGDLPAIVLIDLGNRNFKLIAHARYDRFDNLPFIL